MSFSVRRRRARSTVRVPACVAVDAVGGRDGAEDVTAAVVGDRTDPGQSEPDPAGDALQLAGVERDVGDDDADAAAAGVERGRGHASPSQRRPTGMPPTRSSRSAAEVAQQQHADGAESVEHRDAVPMPALWPIVTMPVPGADDPLGDRPVGCRWRSPRGRASTVSHRPLTSSSHESSHSPTTGITTSSAPASIISVDDSVVGAPDRLFVDTSTIGVSSDAPLAHLDRSRQLAGAVEHRRAGRHRPAVHLATVVGHDRGDPGAGHRPLPSGSSCHIVTCPTRTPGTSVIALCGPVGNRAERRGRDGRGTWRAAVACGA